MMKDVFWIKKPKEVRHFSEGAPVFFDRINSTGSQGLVRLGQQLPGTIQEYTGIFLGKTVHIVGGKNHRATDCIVYLSGFHRDLVCLADGAQTLGEDLKGSHAARNYPSKRDGGFNVDNGL